MPGLISSLMRRANIVLPTITPSPTNVDALSINRSEAYYWQPYLRDRPIAYFDVIHRINFYLTNSSFLPMFFDLKLAMFHYGFKLKAKKEEEQGRLDDWLAEYAKSFTNAIDLRDIATQEVIEIESTATNAEKVFKFSRDAFKQSLIYQNVVADWIDGRNYCNLLKTENCLYSNSMGIETIRYLHQLSWIQIDQLPKDQQDRFRFHPAVFLNPRFGEHWKILKRTPDGEGFGIPEMIGAFRILSEENSKDEGMNMMAWLMRTVFRRHRLGHKSDNPNVSFAKSEQWTMQKHKDTMKQWSGVLGVNEGTANFDEEIDFPWPDPKMFDKTFWEGSSFRLLQWGGPVALMLYAEGVQPFLANMAFSCAQQEREIIQPFLQTCINKGYKPPVEIVVEWGGDANFMSEIIRKEMLAFATQQGSVSPQTVLIKAGLDPEKEGRQKLAAVNDKDAQKKHLPLFDAQHSTTPAIHGVVDPHEELKMKQAKAASKQAKKQKKNGKPRGTKDRS